MSKLLDLLKGTTGEASLGSMLGAWRQAVSSAGDLAAVEIANLIALIQLVTGGGLLPASGITVGARPLDTYPTALLQTGDHVYVQNLKAWFTFDAASAAAADQISVVSAVGPGRFIRDVEANLEWQKQASWFIDPVGGFDENTGLTSGTALKTDAERQLNTHCMDIGHRAFFGAGTEECLVEVAHTATWEPAALVWGAAGNLPPLALVVENTGRVMYWTGQKPTMTGAVPGNDVAVSSQNPVAWAALPSIAAAPDNAYAIVRH